MKKKVFCAVLVSMLLLSTMLCIGTHKVEAESTTVVYVDPEISYATAGQTFSINVSIANVTNLRGYEFRLVWNNTLLNCIEAVDTPPAVWTYVLMGPGLEQNYNSTHGRYFRGVAAYPPSPQFNGSTVLATLTFQVLDVGECVLDLYEVTLVDWKAEIIEDWNDKDSPDDGYFEYTPLQHDIAVFLDVPEHFVPGDSALLSATVFNGGLNNETDVELQLLINGSIVDSTVIDFLLVGFSYAFSYLWTTSTVEATYNVTAYALPVPGEGFTQNNMESIRVLVSHIIRVPFHYPTIQEAIDTANPGDTILVSTGTYYEHLIIDKSLTLVGNEGSIPVIDGGGSGYIIHLRADNIEIHNFTIQNGYLGIWFEAVEGSTISGNMIKNNNAGISLGGSDLNTISNNIILDNEAIGVALDWSYHNTISGNKILNHGGYGLQLIGSSYNTISDNMISNSMTGIYLGMSYHNTIKNNMVTNNINRGILLRTCSNNLISGNTVLDNGIGIHANYTQNNVICHNSFINNTEQVLLGSSSDIWDNGCEGNYWSDYTGEDLNGDGIGDTLLPHQGVDNYPLMSPYMEGDANHDAIVDIVDGVMMGVAFGTEPSDPNWNPHADLNEDGVIDIVDIVIWATHFGVSW